MKRGNPWPAELDYARRLALARRAADRYRERLSEYPNVISVGSGLEFRGRQRIRDETFVPVRYRALRRELQFVPCVQVVVTCKRRRLAKNSRLPEHVEIDTRIAGQHVRIEVPIDVVKKPATSLHAWESQATRGIRWTKGSGTCFVNYGGRRYLLGCHHVLALSELERPHDIEQIAVTWDDQPLGYVSELPKNIDAVDAALALVTADVAPEQVTFGGVRVAGSYARDEPLPPTYYALTRRGVLDVQYVALSDHAEAYYGGTKELTFPNCIWSVAFNGDIFKKGDSGAALVDASGRLIGVHFAGNPNGGRDSYALHAEDVLTAFSGPLEICD